MPLHTEAKMAKRKSLTTTCFTTPSRTSISQKKKILTTLLKLAKAAEREEVRAAFEKHRAETEGQLERLEKVFKIIGKEPHGKICPAINGLAEEGAEIMDEYQDSPVLDVGLIGAARSVEHYEMSRYLALTDWASQLGHSEAVTLLQATLEQEEATDQALATLAEMIGEEPAAEAA
jgi:ferritin-like metal-binding protein YciE